jgi:hypothetical protein
MSAKTSGTPDENGYGHGAERKAAHDDFLPASGATRLVGRLLSMPSRVALKNILSISRS